MVLRKGSKRRLTPRLAPAQPSQVRAVPFAVCLVLAPGALVSQAPPTAGLWRVAGTSLTGPPSLERGAAALFWNPAADPALGRLAVGAQLIQTGEVLGLTGVLVGGHYAARPWLDLGLVLGRMDVRDLVRTSTSPTSDVGTIPVYEQTAGLAAGLRWQGLRIAALLRLHDARFDVLQEGGATVDLGLRFTATPRLRLAAATHFLPVNLRADGTTDYSVAGEYDIVTGGRFLGAPLRVLGRYGASYRPTGDVEHAVGAAAVLAERVRVDAALLGEAGYGDRAWRPVLGVLLRVGRYAVAITRGEGLNDVGATYRIGLDVEVLP